MKTAYILPDDCCASRLGDALREGALVEAQDWNCPECGERWTKAPLNDGEYDLWTPQPVLILR